jgi:hypothetical protein
LGEPVANLGWRKSSYSNGGTTGCVEVGAWCKSSHSNGGSGGCVEVGSATAGVRVRDTTDRAGAVLTVTTAAWRTLLSEIRG